MNVRFGNIIGVNPQAIPPAVLQDLMNAGRRMPTGPGPLLVHIPDRQAAAVQNAKLTKAGVTFFYNGSPNLLKTKDGPSQLSQTLQRSGLFNVQA